MHVTNSQAFNINLLGSIHTPPLRPEDMHCNYSHVLLKSTSGIDKACLIYSPRLREMHHTC